MNTKSSTRIGWMAKLLKIKEENTNESTKVKLRIEDVTG